MPPRRRIHRSLLLSLLGVAILPALLLLALGWRLMEQDHALELQQSRLQLETAGESAVVLLQRLTADLERRLATPTWQPSGAALRLDWTDSSCTARPSGLLLWLPYSDWPTAAQAAAPPDPALFARAEHAEFQLHNPALAASLYRALLARPADASVHAAAQLRLARSLRSGPRPQDALPVYAAMLQGPALPHPTFPAHLIALDARRSLYTQLGDSSSALREARLLAAELLSGRTLVPPSLFALYANSLPDSLAFRPHPEQLAFTELAATLAAQPKDVPTQRSTLLHGLHFTILSRPTPQGASTLLAAPSWLEQQILAPLRATPSLAHLQLSLAPPSSPLPTSPHTLLRRASETQLPWNLVLSSAQSPPSHLLGGRRLYFLAAGLLLLATLIWTGYFHYRSVTRELAAARLQSDFVAAVSHEFRTPLTSMRQFTDLLTDHPDFSPQQRQTCYDALARANSRLGRLVESLLDFGRMEAGARPYQLEPLPLSPFLDQLAEDFSREHPGRLDPLFWDPASRSAHIHADPQALSLALWNLLDNAVKYSPASSPVTFSVSTDPHHVFLSITDRGIGIPPAEQERIFTKFVRGAEALRLGIKGTGIGLAMLRHILDAHSGSVQLDSQPGQGSCFRIRLPRLSLATPQELS